MNKMISKKSKPWIKQLGFVLLAHGCLYLAAQSIIAPLQDRIEEKIKNAELVSNAFINDQALSRPTKMLIEEKHAEGVPLATILLMHRAEAEGDLRERDILMLEGLKIANGNEVFWYLSRVAAYRPDERTALLKEANSSAGAPESRAQMIARATTTLTVNEQNFMAACDSLVRKRYSGVFSAALQVYDLAINNRPCGST